MASLVRTRAHGLALGAQAGRLLALARDALHALVACLDQLPDRILFLLGPLPRGQFWALINTTRARRPQMSVMVATAYMDEAERFDWLMAMDEGKIIATGTLKELLAKTGEPNLDEAFIALMPEAKRALHQQVAGPPRVASPD